MRTVAGSIPSLPVGTLLAIALAAPVLTGGGASLTAFANQEGPDPTALATSTAVPGTQPYRTPIGEGDPFLYGGWEPIGPGEGGGLQAIAPHPIDPDVILAGSDSLGLQLSRDGGKTWKIVNKGIMGKAPFDGNAYVMPKGWHPARPNVAYAARGSILYKSTDWGESWSYGDPTPFHQSASGIAFDPDDPDIIYVVNPLGRTLITRDGGRTFEQMGKLPLEEGERIEVWPHLNYLAIDPESPKGNRTLYAVFPRGLAKSSDGGRTWGTKKIGRSGGGVSSVVVVRDFEDGKSAILVTASSVEYSPNEITREPRLEGQLKHTAEPGVFVSFDGGESWETRREGLPHKTTRLLSLLQVDPSNPRTLYVSTPRGVGSFGRGVYKSIDGGRSWRQITFRCGTDRNMEFGHMNLRVPESEKDSPTAIQGGTIGVLAMAISPADPNLLFLRSSSFVGLMKSTDAGKSWSQIYCDPVLGKPGYWRGRGANLAYADSIAFDPKSPGTLYLGLSDFGSYASEDGGITWRVFFRVMWYGGRSVLGTPLRWPGSSRYYSSGGEIRKHVVKKDEATGTIRGIESKNDVISTVIDPEDTDILYCVAHHLLLGGILVKSTDKGRSYTILGPHVSGFPEGEQIRFTRLALDPRGTSDNRRLYVTAERFGVFKTEDAGRSWKPSIKGIAAGERIVHLGLCPGKPDVLYAASGSAKPDGFRFFRELPEEEVKGGGFGRVYRSDDQGRTWRPVFEGPANIHDLAIHPSDPDIVYLAVANLDEPVSRKAGLLKGGIYRTTDGGRSWEQVFQQPATTAVVIRPDRPDCILAAVREIRAGETTHPKEHRPGIYRSLDAGGSWTEITGELKDRITTYRLLGIDPHDPEVLYVGTTGGFWRKRIKD